MERDARMKAIASAAAEAANNALLPVSVKVGIAAMAEELRELRARLDAVEAVVGDGVTHHG